VTSAAVSRTSARPRRGISARLDRLSDAKFALLMFLPAAIIVGIFVIPPILSVFGMALFRIELLRPGPSRFVGLDNFTVRLPADTNFLNAVPRTILFAAGTTVITVPLAVIAALIMNRPSRYSTLIGVALLLPWAIAPIVTGFYWRFMFQPTFGIFTNIANGLGLAHGTIPWLQETTTALLVAMVATAWRTVPLLALLLLAALRTIPTALFRAARMDGAGPWALFRYVTLPALRSTLLIVTVLTIITSLQTFDVIFQLTKGGPGFDTTTMTYYIFDSAINKLSLGYSAALALLLLFIIVMFSTLVFIARGRRGVQRAEDEDLTASTGSLARGLRASGSTTDAGSAGVALPRYETDEERARDRRIFRIPPGAMRVVFGIGAIAFIVWSVFPTLWILIASLQPEGNVTGRPLTLSIIPDFTHFQTLLADRGWQGSIVNSLEVALGTMALSLLLGALAAYPLARLAVPGRSIFLGVLIFTQMVPGIVLGIPVLLIFVNLGLKDTVVGLIIANTAFLLPLVVWLLKNIFSAVPAALESSARIDGATRLGTLFRITIPAAAAGIAAVAILLLISTWNEFLFAVILGDTGAVTVTRRIGFIDSPTSVSAEPPYTLQAAAGVLAVLPCVILVFLFHRRISAGLTEGYVKG
jgi:multiple sugar transport system permease protein